MRSALLLTAGSIVFIAAQSSFGQATWLEIPNTGGVSDMTPDGSIIVGNGFEGGYYWTMEDGLTSVGESVSGVSDDGTVLIGNVTDPKFDAQAAGVWNETDGWVSIGGLPGGTCGSLSSGYDLDGAGLVGCGLGWETCSGRGFWWSEATGMEQLETLGSGGNRASVLSGNGRVAAGFAQGSFSRTPAVWSSDLGGMLLDPTGDAGGEVIGMSDDGRTLLGTWDQQAFTWTCDAAGNGELTLLGSLNPGWSGNASDIADDGTIIGYDIQPPFDREAWIIPAGGEMQSLSSYLTENGAEGVPGLIQFAQRISRDGTVISGSVGGFPFSAGFVATVPASGGDCIADLDNNGDVGFNDLLILLASWGPCPGDK